MRRLAIVAVLAMTSLPASASDEARCVQQFLNEANFDVGPADGQLGRRSKAQAEMLRGFNPNFKLPELSAETAGHWCEFSTSEPAQRLIERRRVIDTVKMTDADGPRRLWQAYDDQRECGTVPGEPDKLSLRSRDIKVFDAGVAEAMAPIFPSVEGQALCRAVAFAVPLQLPVIDVTSGDKYGDRDGLDRINRTAENLANYMRTYSYDRNVESRDGLVEILLAWAEADGFSRGIRQPDETVSMKFDVIEVLPLFIIAFGEVGPTMDTDERLKVGNWLRRLVGEVQYSAWGNQRQDNKNYLRNYITLLWGILTDDPALRKAAIDEFKTAIYDMRPDGSFPVDSGRGGSGLHYAARATMMLFAIAHTAKLLDEDLFGYEYAGRSIHTAINWVAVSGMFADLNTRHAAPCPRSSNPDYSVEKPDRTYLEAHSGVASIQTWARVYANSGSADPDIAARLIAAQRSPVPASVRESPLGGYFSCFASGVPDLLAE